MFTLPAGARNGARRPRHPALDTAFPSSSRAGHCARTRTAVVFSLTLSSISWGALPRSGAQESPSSAADAAETPALIADCDSDLDARLRTLDRALLRKLEHRIRRSDPLCVRRIAA